MIYTIYEYLSTKFKNYLKKNETIYINKNDNNNVVVNINGINV